VLIRRLRHDENLITEDGVAASRAGFASPLHGRGAARELAEIAVVVAQRGGRGGSGGGRRGGGDDRDGDRLVNDTELDDIERSYADGITAAQVVDIFVSRGLRFSEATFRKYVQQGLLPRSRRVGRKGKHRGSLGVYPAKTVRRINDIKRLMSENYTIEEIHQRFLRFSNVIETLEEGFSEIFARLDEEFADEAIESRARREIKRELREARKSADELMARLDNLARRATSARGDRYRNTGAAGSAEDLL
jgi:hypothetical protein